MSLVQRISKKGLFPTWALFLATCFFVACSSSSGSSSETESAILQADPDHAEMLFVRSSGKSILIDEKMVAEFTYNFSIDKHEVSCGDFSQFSKKFSCEDNEIPITNITFFDAVLFANAKSKSEGFDTAYTYTEAVFDSSGNCSNLVGYAFHADRDAYRLPTEAEWVFVASQNWNLQNEWTADNSGYELHKICSATKSDDKDLPCDFGGNATEWVNDWMGSLRDTTILNFAGAADGGSIGERVIKGGNFRSAADIISLSNRTDVYTVTSSTRANYVGFRLAFGHIPDAVWLSRQGNASSSPIYALTNSIQLKEFTKTYRNNLVFRNDETGNLVWIHFTNGTSVVQEIADSVDVYHPSISPDGKYVAFCTKPEGISGKSQLYVRPLNAISEKIPLDVESAAIPRWRIVDADTEIVYVTDAGRNAAEATWKQASTWRVPFAHGEFGEPQKLFDGTFHGGVTPDGNLAVSGSTLLRVKIHGKDSVWYNGDQACNVSLSDSSRQVLFLDFGDNPHKQILIVDSTGKWIQSIPAPDHFTFDHTEWVNQNQDLIVATLTNSDGRHSKIILVHPQDSNVIELAKGYDLWHPNLWIDGPQNFNTTLDVDSAGQYEVNCPFTGDLSTVYSRYELEQLYTYRDTINVLITGSSRPWAGIDPKILNNSGHGIFSINAANPSVDLDVSKRILMRYGVNLLSKLKVAVVSLDLDILFSRYYEFPSFWNSIYRYTPGFVYDEAHDFWENGYPEGLLELTKNSYESNAEVRTEEWNRLGYKYTPSLGWEGNAVFADSTMLDTLPHLETVLTEPIKALIEEAEAKGIYLIGIIFPQAPGYNETGAFGRYGLRRSVAIQILEILRQFEKTYPHFRLMDENKMGYHDYDASMAMNFDHLSYLGAIQLSNRLDSLIQTLDINF